MALEGQLSDFNLAEILQLIASQQKSGFLVLESRREMVFVFDKGYLISTRDRRSKAKDPLETYLQSYGFFSEAQWKHIEFIKGNSSLDLTEILLSESLLDEEELILVLQVLAQEMAHHGMQLRRGRYHFTATKETPPGVRFRYRLDVQGLLMEAARRLDEETQLKEVFSSQAITFRQGETVPSPEELSATATRIMQLALAGETVGRIIRTGKADSFTVRTLLKTFCDEGYLTLVRPDQDDRSGQGNGGRKSETSRASALKSMPVAVLILVLFAIAGYLRWAPLMTGEVAAIGLAEPVIEITPGVGPGTTDRVEMVTGLDGTQQVNRRLRLRQIQHDVERALELFRYQNGHYPEMLSLLVNQGMLGNATYQLVVELGWTYALIEEGHQYSLAA